MCEEQRPSSGEWGQWSAVSFRGDLTLVLLAPLQLDDNGCTHQAIQERLRVHGCETLRRQNVSAGERRCTATKSGSESGE